MKHYISIIIILLLIVITPIISQEEELFTIPQDKLFPITKNGLYQIEGYKIDLKEGSEIRYNSKERELYVKIASGSIITPPVKENIESEEIKIDFVTNSKKPIQIKTKGENKPLIVYEKISYDDDGFFLEKRDDQEPIPIGGTFDNPEMELTADVKIYIDNEGKKRSDFTGTYLSIGERELVFSIEDNNKEYTLDDAPLLTFGEDTNLIDREDGDIVGIYLISDTTVSMDRTDLSLKPITTVKGGQAIIRQNSLFIKKDGKNIELINKLGISTGQHKDKQGNLVLPFSTTSPMVIKFQDENGDSLIGGKYTFDTYSVVKSLGRKRQTIYSIDDKKSYDVVIGNTNGFGIIEEGKEIGGGVIQGTKIRFSRRVSYNENPMDLSKVHGIKLSVGEVIPYEIDIPLTIFYTQKIPIPPILYGFKQKPLSELNIPESHKNAIYNLLRIHLSNLNEDNLARIGEITIHENLQKNVQLLTGVEIKNHVGGYYSHIRGGVNLDIFTNAHVFVHESGHGIDVSLSNDRRKESFYAGLFLPGFAKFLGFGSEFYSGSEDFDSAGAFKGWNAINTAKPEYLRIDKIISKQSWNHAREIPLRDGGSIMVPQLTNSEENLLEEHLGKKWRGLFQGPGFGYASLYASFNSGEDVAESFTDIKINPIKIARLINGGTHVEGGYDLNTRLRFMGEEVLGMDLNSPEYKTMEDKLQSILNKYNPIMFYSSNQKYNEVFLEKLNGLVRGGHITSAEAKTIIRLAEKLKK